jgi:hypothetical protein
MANASVFLLLAEKIMRVDFLDLALLCRILLGYAYF